MLGRNKIKDTALSVIGFFLLTFAALPLLMTAGNAKPLYGPTLNFGPSWSQSAQHSGTSIIAAINEADVPGIAAIPTTLPALVAILAADELHELSEQEHCLAQAVYFEARSETLQGQLAVAQVVLNRMMDKRYPNQICGVVFQGEHKRNRCQFSFACDGQSDAPRNRRAWAVAKAISYVALHNDWEDMTSLSTHYHADYVSPYWGSVLQQQVQVGRHIFYRDHSF